MDRTVYTNMFYLSMSPFEECTPRACRQVGRCFQKDLQGGLGQAILLQSK
jgi:hypothetical protein